jgi:hypothetical protein
MLSPRAETIRDQMKTTLKEVLGAVERVETDDDLREALAILRSLHEPIVELSKRLEPLEGVEGALSVSVARLQRLRRP